MSNLAHELFLLSANISQFKSKLLIKKVFVESLNSIFPGHSFIWSKIEDEIFEDRIQICTRKNNYGYLIFKNRDELNAESFSLLQNTVQLLAVFLENIEQEELLTNQKENLNEIVQERTAKLVESKAKLKKQKEEISKQNIELKEAKAIAEGNEKINRMLFEILPIGLALTNMNGQMVSINKAYSDIIGYTEEETLKLSYWDVTPKKYEEQEQVQLKNLEEKGFYGPYEKEYIHKSGKLIPVRLIGRIVVINDEKFIWSSVENVSEAKKAEQELISAKEKAEESDRLKTEFFNNMSHEIRTPMNGILGFSSFLNHPNLSDEKKKYYISIIHNSGKQLLRIIDDILEISQLNTKQVKVVEKEVCLNNLLLELFSIFGLKAKENKVPLYLKKGLSDENSTIFIDDNKLNKILSNLLENALKFTNSGFIEFGYQLKGEKIVIYVKDTGVGIHKNKHKIIFERFSQEEKELSKKVGGLGLGLSIAKENAELLGGQITVDSKKGEGAVFYVTLPYKPVNAFIVQEKIRNVSFAKHENGVYTILIVEDEEINSLYLETLFQDGVDLKNRTLLAKHGKEAVEICKGDIEIDMILMDLKMPVMNGFEATKLIKQLRPQIPIIAQTAYTSIDDQEKAFQAGCDEFISKPINLDNLNEIFKKHILV